MQSLASGKERVTETSEGFRTFLAEQCPGPFKDGGMIFGNFWRNKGIANSQVGFSLCVPTLGAHIGQSRSPTALKSN